MEVDDGPVDTRIIAMFCRIDDALRDILQGQGLLQREPEPALPDAEVLTMEVVGEFLGYSRDTAIYRYFRRHYRRFFPALAQVCRTTFARQAANLWRVKERVWEVLLGSIGSDMTRPLPSWAVCPSPCVASPGLTAASGSRAKPFSGGMRWRGRLSTACAST